MRTKVELHEDSGESPRPESRLGEAPLVRITRTVLLPLELVEAELEDEALAATIETLSRFSRSTSSSSDSVSESP